MVADKVNGKVPKYWRKRGGSTSFHIYSGRTPPSGGLPCGCPSGLVTGNTAVVKTAESALYVLNFYPYKCVIPSGVVNTVSRVREDRWLGVGIPSQK